MAFEFLRMKMFEGVAEAPPIPFDRRWRRLISFMLYLWRMYMSATMGLEAGRTLEEIWRRLQRDK